jgi:thiazole/oxazole-forming peptide maturase SagD family component
MINLQEYLKTDKEKNKFLLPVSKIAKLKFYLLQKYLKLVPFLDSTYVEDEIPTYYWRIIFSYLKNNFGVSINIYRQYFRDRFFYFGARVFYTVEDNYFEHIRSEGADYDDIELSISRGVGEFLERYSTTVIDVETKSNLKNFSFKHLKELGVVFSSDYHKMTSNFSIKEKENFECLEVEEIFSRKKTQYPYRHLYWNNMFTTVKNTGGYEFTTHHTTTSGCAGGFTEEDAVLAAFYELIERDSFMCYWQTRTIPKKIIIPNNSLKEYDILVEKCAEIGVYIYLLDCTTDIGIPVCVCVAVNKETSGLLVTGGCNIDWHQAIKTSTKEMSQMLSVFDFEPIDLSKQFGRSERIYRAGCGKFYNEYKFLIEGESENFANLKSVIGLNKSGAIEKILKILKEKGDGYDKVYKYLFQNRYLKDLGFFVVRVIIPKLYPLHLLESLNLKVSERLEDFSFWQKGSRDYVINSTPHPFP